MKFKLLNVTILAGLLIAAGCKKDFLDVNTNPNSLPTATPAFVITNALNVTASNMVGPNQTGFFWAAQWTQSSSYILTPTIFSYNFTNTDLNFWDGFYDNLQDYQYVINNADAAGQKYFKGPAKVMKALLFHTLVDMYGNIPYTDALKGVGALAPKFDDQKAVYEDLIKMLDEAIADTKANAFASAYAGSDIIFKGNTGKWIKFANSLKLRLLMHQSRITGRDAYIIAEINKIVTEGSGFITGEDIGSGSASFYQATAGKINPVYNTYAYDANGGVNAFGRYPRPTKNLFDALIASNDTFRLKRIAYAKGGENAATPGISVAPEIVSNYVGVPYGVGSGYTAPSTSYIGPSLFVKGEYNRPFILMTGAEIQFLLAEAKQRYGAGINLSGTAQSYYEEGVRQSFRLDGVADATAKANILLASGIADADWAASTDKLKAIATQKWIAMTNFSGIESWTEYRRTNMPVIPQSQSYTGPERPLRLYYPSSETGSNAANVKAQGTIDALRTRIFWDVD